MSQPVQVYPNTVGSRHPPSHSCGSFGTVFIVLAGVVALSAIACCIGRFCNRRRNHRPAAKQHDRHSHATKEGQQPREVAGQDIESGLENSGKAIQKHEPSDSGGSHPSQPSQQQTEIKRVARFADDEAKSATS